MRIFQISQDLADSAVNSNNMFVGVENSREPQAPNAIDRWILSQLSLAVDTVNTSIESADLHLATTSIKNFLYYTFCDYYVV